MGAQRGRPVRGCRSLAHVVVLVVLAGIAGQVHVARAAPSDPAKGPSSGNSTADSPVSANGNVVSDLSATGNCQPEVQQFCSSITPGESRLADCLSDQIEAFEIAAHEEEGAPSISDACREEVYQFKITTSTHFAANIPLARACKVDAEKLCGGRSWMLGAGGPGEVIACLREVHAQLAPGCKREVFKLRKAGAEDYRADAELHEACQRDAEALCKDVKPGGGRIQACLRSHPLELDSSCMEQLYRQEAENADDIRLSVRLYAKCLPDKRKFCKDVAPGQARVKDCLEAHRTDPGFSPACKEEIDAMIERRATDFRLDTSLKEACADDIARACTLHGELDGGERNGYVIKCLQDFVDEIRNDACRQKVRKYQELAAQNIRFDVPLAHACYKDRQQYCSAVPAGSARVIRCLRRQRDQLSADCRAALFDEEVNFGENIDFQYPMRKACKAELELYCRDVPHGEARAIRCLQEHKYQKDFSKDCKEEVRLYESEASSDYRFNHRLRKACKEDINALCALACANDQGKVCGGKVLRCLTSNREALSSEACRHEVHYFEKMEVTDYRNDVILAAACQADVDKWCKYVEPGEGRVHECLRNHREQLSEECRSEELLLEELEAEDVELKPGLMRMCKDERHIFCQHVQPGGARMFRCLAEKMGDLDFGDMCRNEITSKLQRRQANWKLDPTLRKACRDDVAAYCSAEDGQRQERALVYKCLIKAYSDLDAGCQKELGRALHMAFFIWQPDQLLTQECDGDVRGYCLTARPSMDKTPGAVGQCLAGILDDMAEAGSGGRAGSAGKAPRTLSPACRALADIAQPPDVKRAFDASLTVAVLQAQLQRVQGATGLPMVNTDRYGNARGVTLTGWSAVAGMSAFVLIIIWGVGYAWKRYWGIPDKDLTLVVKKTHR